MQVPAAEISAFLVIAAKLIQIKSEALLPRPPSHERGEENLGEALAQQLLIYKRFKEMAAWLGQREEKGFHSYVRMATPPHVEGRIDLSGISVVDLQRAFEAVLEDKEDKIALGSVITAPRITIREKISMIISHLSSKSDARFSDLVGNSSSRLEVVVTFLALLELIKRYRVTATQDILFSDIQFVKTTEWDSREELDIEFE
jgi:segregation and condensation protein A